MSHFKAYMSIKGGGGEAEGLSAIDSTGATENPS